MARERGERGEEAWGLVLQGEIALRRAPGAMEAAAERYRQALALATELGMRPLIAHCHAGLARSGAGDDHLGRATEMYREMQMSSLLYALDARRPGAWDKEQSEDSQNGRSGSAASDAALGPCAAVVA